MFIHHQLLVCGTLLLSACATRSPETMADWRHGAKHAWVVDIVQPNSALVQSQECLSQLPPSALSKRRFVQVRYWHSRHTLYTVAERPDALPLDVNDEVELWPEDCDHGRVPYITRKLAARSQ